MLASVVIQMVSIVQQQTINEMEGKPSAWKLMQIATSDADICRRYTEGMFALMNNLPHPPVCFVDGHAYVFLRDKHDSPT